jgi:hypothetical protein
MKRNRMKLVPSRRSMSPRSQAARRRCALTTEVLEPRVVLSGTGGTLTANGVDSLALGDVNADRLVDIIVAGRQAGTEQISIYDGHGKDAKVNPLLATPIPGSQIPGTGPIQVAAGNFQGTGISELAVTRSGPVASGPVTVSLFTFALASGAEPGPIPTADPTDAPVKATRVGSAFAPQGLSGATGLSIAAGSFYGTGDELAIASTSAGSTLIDIERLQANQTWTLVKQLSFASLKMTGGVWLAAGDVTGLGGAKLVLGSRNSGEVAVYNFTTGTWKTFMPLGAQPGGVRVSVVDNEYAPGAIVVTPAAPAAGSTTAAMIWANAWTNGWTTQTFKPIQSPGTGALIPLGGGWVYPRSSISPSAGSLFVSQGPSTPTVILGSASSDTLVVQGFKAKVVDGKPPVLTPSTKDTYSEPILASATPGAAWTALEVPGDMPGLSGAGVAPIVAYPEITYTSPYAITLSDPASALGKGLLSHTFFTKSVAAPWGPDKPVNTPPTVPASVPTDKRIGWLQQRLLYAYSQAIGVAYQHHHNPFWLPQQGRSWIEVAHGYQSPGIDCTNLTSYMYENALGITLNAATAKQASIGLTPQATSAYLSVPQSMKKYVNVQVIAPPTSASDYADFIKQLQPGDILFISPSRKFGDPEDPSKCTHAITWLGTYGTMANGGPSQEPLIIDSTGNQPTHVNANNQGVPDGVEIRPFGSSGPLNGWYFEHVDHVLRILG